MRHKGDIKKCARLERISAETIVTQRTEAWQSGDGDGAANLSAGEDRPTSGSLTPGRLNGNLVRSRLGLKAYS